MKVASFCWVNNAQIWALCQIKIGANMDSRGKKLSTKEAAVILGYSPYTLRNWRQGFKRWRIGLSGPKFDSIHGRIFYTEDALDDWMKLCGTERHIDVPKSTLEYCSKLD